jgi:hypothetical protein
MRRRRGGLLVCHELEREKGMPGPFQERSPDLVDRVVLASAMHEDG